MDLSDIEEFFKRFRRNPVRTLALLTLLALAVGGIALLTSYSSEIGKRAAAPAPAPPPNKATERSPPPAAKEPAAGDTALEGPLSIEDIGFGQSPEEIRISVVLRNNAHLPLLVTQVTVMPILDIEPPPSPLTSHPIPGLVAVQNPPEIRIRKQSAGDASAAFTYRVEGKFAGGKVYLSTFPSIQIPPRSLYELHFVVPNELRVHFTETINPTRGAGVTEARRNTLIDVDLRRTTEIEIFAFAPGYTATTRRRF